MVQYDVNRGARNPWKFILEEYFCLILVGNTFACRRHGDLELKKAVRREHTVRRNGEGTVLCSGDGFLALGKA